MMLGLPSRAQLTSTVGRGYIRRRAKLRGTSSFKSNPIPYRGKAEYKELILKREVLEDLPKFQPKNAPYQSVDQFILRVTGAVVRPQTLRLEDILNLPKVNLTSDFTCVEGWSVKEIVWSGVRVKDLFTLAEPKSTGKYVLFKAGEFTKLMDIQSATRDDTILTYKYKGEMLTYEHGAPLRLIFPSQQCYESVKWVNEIEVLEQPIKDTGRDIALSRIQTKR